MENKKKYSWLKAPPRNFVPAGIILTNHCKYLYFKIILFLEFKQTFKKKNLIVNEEIILSGEARVKILKVVHNNGNEKPKIYLFFFNYYH